MPHHALQKFAFVLLALGFSTQHTLADASRLASDLVRPTIALQGQRESPLAKVYTSLRREGLALQVLGEHGQAIESFRHLQSLVHREHGVRSVLQAESIRDLTRSYIASGDLRNADRQQKFLYGIYKDSYSVGSTDMYEARSRLATWYRSTFRYKQALSLYAQSRRYLDTAESSGAVLTGRILRAEALTFVLSGHCCAIDKLREARALVSRVESNGSTIPRITFEDYAKISLELADAQMFEGQSVDALKNYSAIGRAQDAVFLGLNKARDLDLASRRSRADYDPHTRIIDGQQLNVGAAKSVRSLPVPPSIGEPVSLCTVDLMADYSRNRYAGYYLDTVVDVGVNGSAAEISMTGSAPAYLQRLMRVVFEKSRYRPKVNSEGVAVLSQLTFRQTFNNSDERPLVDDIRGWSSLLARRTCTALASSRGM
jgi:tetratricopeptide (TPR) repeat protein